MKGYGKFKKCICFLMSIFVLAMCHTSVVVLAEDKVDTIEIIAGEDVVVNGKSGLDSSSSNATNTYIRYRVGVNNLQYVNYLVTKFNLTDIPDNMHLTDARIKFYVASSMNSSKTFVATGLNIWENDNCMWSESDNGGTWPFNLKENDTVPDSQVITVTNATVSDSNGQTIRDWLEADITDYVFEKLTDGSEEISFIVSPAVKDINVNIYTKDSDYKPVLELTFEPEDVRIEDVSVGGSESDSEIGVTMYNSYNTSVTPLVVIPLFENGVFRSAFFENADEIPSGETEDVAVNINTDTVTADSTFKVFALGDNMKPLSSKSYENGEIPAVSSDVTDYDGVLVDYTAKTVSFTGNAQTDEPDTLSVFVYKNGEDDRLYQYVDLIHTDENGGFEVAYKLDDNSVGGDMIIEIAGMKSENISYPSGFYYASVSETNEALNAVNTAKNSSDPKSAVSEAIEKYNRIFNLNLEGVFSLLNDDNKNVLYTLISEMDFENTVELSEFFNLKSNEIYDGQISEIVLKDINGATSDTIDSVLNNDTAKEKLNLYYGPVTDDDGEVVFDIEAVYNDNKDEINDGLLNQKFKTIEDVVSTFDELMFVCCVNNAEPSNIKALCDEYRKRIPALDTKLKKAEKEKFSYKKILSHNFDDIEELFDEIDSVIKAETSSKGSGGGGSGTKSTPVTVIPSQTPVVEQTLEKLEVPVLLFNDLTGSHWARVAIEDLAGKGIISGDENGNFVPEREVSREEFVKMIVETFDLYNENSNCDFEDVTKDNWFYGYVSSAYEAGIINGKSDVSFGSGEKITRQDMAVIIINSLLKVNQGVELTETAQEFSDDDKIGDYAKSAVYMLKNLGIINGRENNIYAPEMPATRAEAAQIIYRVSKLVQNHSDK